MKHKLIGIDLAKSVFQVCAINQAGKDVFNRAVTRAKLAETMALFEPTTVAMEACASGHSWGRKFEQMATGSYWCHRSMCSRSFAAAGGQRKPRSPSRARLTRAFYEFAR